MASPILKYEASAGSGKTYRLALEYLGRLLLAFAGPDGKSKDPKRQRERLGSILAITFTVKAAQEMKRRILKQLKAFALSGGEEELDGENKEFLERLAGATRISKERIIELAGELIELVLASYDDFNVKTIDSLMSAMVKVIAPDLDLPADYEIAVDARDELEARGRALIAGLADNDGTWRRLEPFLREFRHLGAASGWKTDVAVVEKIIALFRKTLKQGDAGTNSTPDELRAQMAASWQRFQRALRPLSAVMNEEPLEKGKNKYVSGTCARDNLLRGMRAALGEGNGFPGLDALIEGSFFRKQDPGDLVVKKTPDDYRRRFISAYLPAQDALQDAALAFSAFKTIPYREYLGEFTAAWHESKEILFVEEFSQTLARLFDTWQEEAFPYLYLKMSDRFGNFLFDEFQDTSTLQFRALAPLIDEVLSREKEASLFIVGDRKQAIYRWRGGNSGLMDESCLRELVPAIANVEKGGFSHTLDKNWRSRREIVDFNNRFWAPEAISGIEAEPGLQSAIRANFQDSRQALPSGEERAGGYVEISLQVEEQETAGEEEEGSAMGGRQLGEVKAIIDRLHGLGFEYSDIAVLVRKNAQVRDIVRRLGREKEPIPTLSDQSLMLDSSPLVNEIIAFLKFLDYPPDDLNFHAFINGRIFQEALAGYPRDMAAFSWDAFIGCRGPMYKVFQEKFPASWAGLIEPFFQAVGFLPPYDLFSDMTQVFHIYENFPGAAPFIMALGDALHGAERDEGHSISGFLRLWKKMMLDEEMPTITIPENTPGVRVLTMHQSKGLEFKAVIVPLDDRRGKSSDPLHWDREGLFHIDKKLALANPGLREKFDEENIRSSVDLLNLLYVSFTRAKEALFVPVSARKDPEPPLAEKDGLTRRIVKASDVVGRHPLLAWFEKKARRSFAQGILEKKERGAVGTVAAVDVPGKKVLTRSWQETYLVFSKADIRKQGDRSGAERGERIHDLLSRIGAVRDPMELDSRVRQLATQAGWPASATAGVVDLLLREDVFALLCRGTEACREKEVMDNSGTVPKLRRLDRLQAGPGEVLVIDFKTGMEKSAEHISQVREYMATIAPLYPGRNSLGFIVYIDRNEVEEVRCSS
jgi:ATP-dependent exoDNAse (exonuclease V) beta subunit